MKLDYMCLWSKKITYFIEKIQLPAIAEMQSLG